MTATSLGVPVPVDAIRTEADLRLFDAVIATSARSSGAQRRHAGRVRSVATRGGTLLHGKDNIVFHAVICLDAHGTARREIGAARRSPVPYDVVSSEYLTMTVSKRHERARSGARLPRRYEPDSSATTSPQPAGNADTDFT